MNNERLIYEGRLAELRQQEQQLRSRLKGLRDDIAERIALVRPIEEMQGEQIFDKALQFNDMQIELRGVLQEAIEIKKIMGR